MNVITHALLPVTAKQAVELVGGDASDYKTQWRGWLVVGAFGILPDVLTPHISLGARCNSFSHAWPCTSIVFLGCGACWLVFRKRPWGVLAPWCGLAYVLHVAGDIVSGGLDFLQTGNAIGDWWIVPELWPVLDLVFVVAFVLLHRGIRKRCGLNPSVVQELRRCLRSGTTGE